MSDEAVFAYTRAMPFRPFRIQMVSGRIFDVHHPDFIEVGKRDLVLFRFAGDRPDSDFEWVTLGLLLVESISHIENAVIGQKDGN